VLSGWLYLRPATLVCAVVVALSVAATPALALDPTRALNRYVHQAWTTDEGLPQNSVYAVIQTGDGYLWLGTDEGLVRFDGLRFAVFDRTNTQALVDPFVFTLHESADGSLWAGTDRGGLTRYRNGRFSHYGPGEGLPPGRIQAIASDARGTLWIGLRGAGLARLDGDRFTTFTARDGLSNDNVLALLVDSAGTLWAGTDAGLDRFEGARFVHMTASDGLPAGGVRAIHEDRSRRLWIGMLGGPLGARHRDGGLCVKNGGRFQVVSAHTPLPSIGVMTIVDDRDGNLWLGTAGGGILRFRDGRFDNSLLADTPADDMVYALAEDREGSLWIGTQPGGLHRLRNSRFETYEKRDGLTDEVIESLLEDRGGVMWIGTHAGGVCTVEGRSPRCLTTKDGLAHDRVNAMAEEPDGSLWLGTEGGLNRLNGRTATALYTTADGLPVNHVNALLRDRAGQLWIGTWGGGVARMSDGGAVQPIAGTGRYVNVLYQRRSGELWIGTTEGLGIWTGQTMIDATEKLGTPPAVEAIYEDRDGNVWIGTRRDGLFLYKDGRLTQYTTRAGLYDNLVGTLLEDGNGNFWMTCNKGIFRVSRQELLEVAAGTRATVASRAFDTADGLKNRECDFGQGRWQARDGRLWFATVGGVAVIDPAGVASNSAPTSVQLQQLIVDGDELSTDPPPTLGYGKRHVEFRFVVLSLSAPSRVRYRYRLEGFDPDWIDAADSRTAHYTNIPPGSYRFHVIASNGEGVWSSDAGLLAFTVASPIWRRPWFVLLLFALTLVAVLAVGQVRLARLRHAQEVQAQFSRQLISSQENERTRLAGELHDGIGQHLLIIGNWARLALNAAAAADPSRSPLQMITESAADSIREIRALTRELQPYIEHAGLPEALETMLRRLGEASGVTFTTNIEPIDDVLPVDGGIQVYRIVQEAANNIVKHARASHARVIVERRRDSIYLSVADDGRGLPPEAADGSGDGFGMRSLAARTHMLGGRHQIESPRGGGTTITVEIPVGPSGAGDVA
jgi:ligand-binding sensor domain-containing protein/signal transduction histidine kinase